VERAGRDAHIDGAVNHPLAHMASASARFRQTGRLVVDCASGYRSAIATSLLRRERLPRVAGLVGGLAAWISAQLPTVAATV
jgi:rhodanese-related sulfurtransferase